MKKKKRDVKKLYTLPGELIYTGNKTEVKTSIEQINYSRSEFSRSNDLDINKSGNNLIVITGFNDLKLIKTIGEKIKLHKLILEDILNTSQNIKLSVHEEKIFITMKDFLWEKESRRLSYEQVSFLIIGNSLYLFLEEKNKIIDTIIKRIEEKKGLIKDKNIQYLLFAILDIFIDSYMQITSDMEEVIIDFEEKINVSPEEIDVKEIFDLKKNVVNFKKDTFYLREMLKKILSDNINFDLDKRIYFEDLYDKSIKIHDYVDDCKEDINGLVNYHMTQLSNNMNKIMKVLTFISTIFIPISFLAGLYGMNFDHMPELHYKYSYPILLGTMFFIVLLMIRFFKKRKWF